MVALNEDNIEEFIRKNKDKIGVYHPPESHFERFLLKMNFEIKHIISIVPYIIRVAFATIIIFTASIIIWNNFIRKDRDEVTLRNKITSITSKVKTLYGKSKF